MYKVRQPIVQYVPLFYETDFFFREWAFGIKKSGYFMNNRLQLKVFAFACFFLHTIRIKTIKEQYGHDCFCN
jgi:hypothetical protein